MDFVADLLTFCILYFCVLTFDIYCEIYQINTTETEQVPKDLEIESSSKVGEDTDFKDPIPPLVRRKRKRKDAQNE